MVELEVLWSWKQELDDFGAGMESLGLLTLLRRNPDVCKSLLCNGENGEFGPEEFEQCSSHPDVPDDFVQAQAYEWFNVYIAENPNSESFQGGCRLKALLHFSTGYQVPPSGQSLPHKVSIHFCLMMISISYPLLKHVLVIWGCQQFILLWPSLASSWIRLFVLRALDFQYFNSVSLKFNS